MKGPLLDKSLQRTARGEFTFPLGVYPVEPMAPAAGYVAEFEPADASESFISGAEVDDWEEWPDRWMFDVLLPATRLRGFCNLLFSLFPGRAYPILDVLGHDAYREIDPYIAYELVGMDRFYDGIRDYAEWLFEDGLVGFGLMSLEPFLYAFIDEHKIVTIRAELALKETIEKLLAAFDLAPVEKLTGPDSVEHEHRTVLLNPEDESHPMTSEEIIEDLRDLWLLQFNIDGSTNLDDQGNDLGITCWRCLARCNPPQPAAEDASDDSPPRYAEIILRAASLDQAEEIAADALTLAANASPGAAPAPAGETTEDPPSAFGSIEFVAHDRMTPEDAMQFLERQTPPDLTTTGIDDLRWLATEPE